MRWLTPPDGGGYREERRGERKEGRRDRMVRLGDQQRMLQTPDEPIQMETGLRLEAAAQCTAGQRGLARATGQRIPAPGARRHTRTDVARNEKSRVHPVGSAAVATEAPRHGERSNGLGWR